MKQAIEAAVHRQAMTSKAILNQGATELQGQVAIESEEGERKRTRRVKGKESWNEKQ
jgi:hypothetical protein